MNMLGNAALVGVLLTLPVGTALARAAHPNPGADALVPPAEAAAKPVPGLDGEARDIVLGRTISMPSKIFGPPVRLDVSLPQGYESGNGRYPVLVAFQVSGGRFAAVAGIAAGLAEAGVAPPMIVVGAGLDGDVFSFSAKEGRPGTGRGPEVLAFLRGELFPYLESHYRTEPFRILLGHSASALFGLWALFEAPDVVPVILSAGPMFAEADSARVRGMIEAAAVARPAGPRFLFFTQGDQPELDRDLATFREWLTKRRAEGLDWTFDPEPGENHASLAIATAYDGLRTLFADWAKLPEDVALKGAPAIRAYKAELAERFGYEIGLSASADFHLKVKWGAERRFDALIALARYGCEERPDDYYSHLSLAIALEQSGRFGEAVASYETALKSLKDLPAEKGAPIRGRLEAMRDEARKKAGPPRRPEGSFFPPGPRSHDDSPDAASNDLTSGGPGAGTKNRRSSWSSE